MTVSAQLHGEEAAESEVVIDTTVQEKNIIRLKQIRSPASAEPDLTTMNSPHGVAFTIRVGSLRTSH